MRNGEIVMNDDFVTVPMHEWKRIQEQLDWLECLEAAGVDNWSGIDYAIELSQEEDD